MAPKVDYVSRKQLEDLIIRVLELERKDIENLSNIDKLMSENVLLTARVKILEEKQTNNILDWSKLFNSKKCDKSAEEIKVTQGIIDLSKDVSKRDKNIIVFGIQNSTDSDAGNRKKFDENILKNLFSEIKINPDKIRRIHRFKNTNENNTKMETSTPLLVELPDSSDKFAILKAAKQLKDSESFKKVSIHPDQNELERKFTKSLILKRNKLNEELNLKGQLNNPFRFGIRNNEVKKIRTN
jgi:hypothetical protein